MISTFEIFCTKSQVSSVDNATFKSEQEQFRTKITKLSEGKNRGSKCINIGTRGG